MIKLVLFI